MRIALAPAYILHARPFRDTSLILDVYTHEHGRVGLTARGARTRVAWRGLLTPFRPLLLSWSGRGELPTLTGVEPAGAALLPGGQALLAALYLNELLLRLLTRHDPHAALYHDYAAALTAIAGNAPLAPALRRFEFALLAAVGYGVVTDHDVAGAPIDAGRDYVYLPERGPVAADTLPAAQIETGVAVPGAALLAWAAGRHDDPAHAAAAKPLLRACLTPHLGPRPLATRALFGATLAAGEGSASATERAALSERT